jgi:pyruvate/2-oxoglutarate/acetoin dehydrogenase E1 component
VKDGNVPEMMYRVPLDQPRAGLRGQHVTVAAFSYANFDALLEAETLLSNSTLKLNCLICAVFDL